MFYVSVRSIDTPRWDWWEPWFGTMISHILWMSIVHGKVWVKMVVPPKIFEKSRDGRVVTWLVKSDKSWRSAKFLLVSFSTSTFTPNERRPLQSSLRRGFRVSIIKLCLRCDLGSFAILGNWNCSHSVSDSLCQWHIVTVGSQIMW